MRLPATAPPAAFAPALRLGLALALGLGPAPAVGASVQALDGAEEFTRSVVRLEEVRTRIALRDVNGDGRQDLVFVEEAGLGVRTMREGGTYPSEHDAFLAWPGERLAWCLADVDGDGSTELAFVVDGTEVRVYSHDADGGFGAGEVLLETPVDLPHGVVRMAFFRDVDGDGALDVVLPSAGHFNIFRRGADGAYEPPIRVRLQARIGHDVGNPDELGGRFGQSVRIPWFRLEDVDGDGRLDLVAETEDEVLFHLAEPGPGARGSRLAPEPTWRLDLAALESELPPETIDLDDLLSMAARGVQWRVADLDGEGANELVLQVSGRIRVWRGGSRTGPVGAPDQLLKSSGNVLFFFLRDVDDDGRTDLQILRGGKLSVSNVLRWLILPGKIDFELFTYAGEDGAFSRRPVRRNVISFRFPRLFTFIKEMEERTQELANLIVSPTRRAALDADGVPDDVLDVRGGELVVFHGAAPAEDDLVRPEGDEATDYIEAFVLEELDEAGDGGTKTLDLGELDEWGDPGGAALREACSGLEPDLRLPLIEDGRVGMKILVRDLDGDGRTDLIVVGRGKESRFVVQFFVR